MILQAYKVQLDGLNLLENGNGFKIILKKINLHSETRKKCLSIIDKTLN